MKLFAIVIVTCFLFSGSARPAFAHGDEMLIGSSADAGGQLSIDPEFDFDDAVFLPPSVTVGGITLYTDIIPSFGWVIEPEPSATPVIFPLTAGTEVSLELLSIDSGAAVQIRSQRLTAGGQSALLGEVSTDPEAHVHPEWQLTLAEGVSGSFALEFRLTTSNSSYAASPIYHLTLTNIEPPSPCAGDCDLEGDVTVDELVIAINIALGAVEDSECEAADTNGDELVTVDEILQAVNNALVGCVAPG